MTKNQYENIISETIKNESADKSGLDTVRNILKNLGIGFPKGNVKEITDALETEDFMGWEKCNCEKAEEALENGTPVIAVSCGKVFVVTGDKNATDISEKGVVNQEELKRLPGVLMYMYSGDTTDDVPEGYMLAPHFNNVMFIQNCFKHVQTSYYKYLKASSQSPTLPNTPAVLLNNQNKWQFIYPLGADYCFIVPLSDTSKRLCVDDVGNVFLESSGTNNKAIRWQIYISNLSDTHYLIRNKKTAFYLCGSGNTVMTSITNNQLKSKWIIRDDAKDEYTYPSDSRILSRGYYDGPIVEHIHYGLDIVGYHVPIYAIADGIVSYTQTSDVPDAIMATMGNAIAINHYNPDTDICNGEYARSIYMHMDSPSNFAPGDFVAKGTQIGLMGMTGNADGAHLHFELSVGDNSAMAPGQQGWIYHPFLPNLNSVVDYFPEYHI